MIRDIQKAEKRLFVSILLERHFSTVFSKYRDTHGRIPYLRWKPTKNLHVTILFIGHIPESQVEEVSSVLAQVVSIQKPFLLTLQKVSYAPPNRQADMVWAYFQQSDALDGLAHAIHHALSASDVMLADSFKSGETELLPHVTLARFNDKQVRQLMSLRRTELEGHHMLVEEVYLTESISTPNGTVFKHVASYALNPSL